MARRVRRPVRWVAATAAAVAAVVTVSYVNQDGGQLSAADGQWYAAPDGVGDGSSASSPMGLQTAIGIGSPVQPGDIINVEPGLYSGCFYNGVSGTPTSPIVVQGKNAVIDGAPCTSPQANTGPTVLNMAGNDVQWHDLEITDSTPGKFNPEPGSNPSYRRPNGINLSGQRVKVINFYVHDTGDGIFFGGAATDSEVYGTVFARSGWVSTDRAHGHAIYVQNVSGVKRITNTVVLDTYSQGVTAYATAGQVLGVYFDGLIAANSGRPDNSSPDREANILIGTEQNPADDVRIDNSVSYHEAGYGGAVRAGYGVPGNRVSITNSDMVGGSQALDLKGWQQATVTGNTFYATASLNPNANDILAYVASLTGGTWNNNAYFDRTRTQEAFAYNGTVAPNQSQLLTWGDWRINSGFDAASTYTQATPADKVIVQPNVYEPGRSNVIVLNWSRANSRLVDVGPGGHKVYDAETMTQVASGSGPVSIPTPNEFGAFVTVPDDTQPPPSTTTTAPPVITTTTAAPPPPSTEPTSTTIATTTTTHKPKPCRKFMWWCI